MTAPASQPRVAPPFRMLDMPIGRWHHCLMILDKLPTKRLLWKYKWAVLEYCLVGDNLAATEKELARVETPRRRKKLEKKPAAMGRADWQESYKDLLAADAELAALEELKATLVAHRSALIIERESMVETLSAMKLALRVHFMPGELA